VTAPSGFVEMPDGVRLYYTTLGSGPDVVCVQAGFYFEEAFASLTQGRTFVLLHQRGRGLSEMRDGAAEDIPHEIADLDVVREALGIDRWSVIGWSYMGLVAVSHALDHPDRVERIVHLCSLGPDVASYADDITASQAKGLARTDPADLQRLNEMGAEGLIEADPVAYTKQFARVVCSMQMEDKNALARVDYSSAAWPNEWLWRPREAWQTSFEVWDERERLPSLSVPMLVVHAAEDLIPERAARDTASLAGDARFLQIDRSGHWPWLERPDVLLPALDTFLGGEWPAGAQDVRAR
jgi:proline iminopeptidase